MMTASEFDSDAGTTATGDRFEAPRDADGPRLGDTAAWRRLQADVLSGVRHEVLGRVSALKSLIQIGRRGRYSAEEITSLVEEETSRLERTTDWLRALPEEHDSDPEPLGLRDLLDDMVDLTGALSEVQDLRVEFDGETSWPPVRAERPELARCLFSLLVGLGADSGTIVVEARIRDGWLRVTMQAAGDAVDEDDREYPVVGAGGKAGADAAEALCGSLERMGADVSLDVAGDGRDRCVLWLPLSRGRGR